MRFVSSSFGDIFKDPPRKFNFNQRKLGYSLAADFLSQLSSIPEKDYGTKYKEMKA